MLTLVWAEDPERDELLPRCYLIFLSEFFTNHRCGHNAGYCHSALSLVRKHCREYIMKMRLRQQPQWYIGQIWAQKNGVGFLADPVKIIRETKDLFHML